MSTSSPLNKVIGTVLPLFAIRSRHDSPNQGSGTISGALTFLDWLATTQQRAWQILPVSQTHLEPGSRTVHVSSPYKGYGIGLDPRYLNGAWATAEPSAGELAEFVDRHAEWVHDYVVFIALRDHFGTDDWTVWPEDALRRADSDAVTAWVSGHQAAIDQVTLEQWRLNRAFTEIRRQAQERHIEIIGDLPFYIPLQSPLVWANQDCFDLEPDGRCRRASGIPDGPESHFGRQVWGHPLYAWGDAARNQKIIGLWERRLRGFGELYDTLRLDHAKGLFNFGVIDLDIPNNDRYVSGPGLPVLQAIIDQAEQLNIQLVAEDTGDRLTELRQALTAKQVPGIRVLRFAYNEKRQKLEAHFADVANYPNEAFAYTTTTDTVTLIRYVETLTTVEQDHLCQHVGVTYTEDKSLLAHRLRQRVLDSPAGHVMVPLQDWFLWPDRINVPGTETPTADPNWRWRMPIPVEELPTEILSHLTTDRT